VNHRAQAVIVTGRVLADAGGDRPGTWVGPQMCSRCPSISLRKHWQIDFSRSLFAKPAQRENKGEPVS
jgi:hypothetical protein